MDSVQIEFFKPVRRRYRSVLHRRDGLLVELDGGGYNKVGGDRLSQAEMLTRAICDLCLDGADRDLGRLRAAVGDRWWSPAITVDALASACRDLREAGIRWRDVPPGEALRVTWRLPPPR